MKKTIVITSALLLISCAGLFYAKNSGLMGISTSYIQESLEKNVAVQNYEKHLSMSISFDDKGEMAGDLKSIDNTLLLLSETRDNSNYSMTYQFGNEENLFEGSQTVVDNQLVVKTPMYHRYIVFNKYKEQTPSTKNIFYQPFLDYVLNNQDSMKVDKNLSANEENVRTLTFENNNDELKKLINQVLINSNDNNLYESILLNNAKVKNKLLKLHHNEEEVMDNGKEDIDAIYKKIHEVLLNSKVNSSKFSVKVDEFDIFSAWSVQAHVTYIHPKTNKEVPFTLYIDLNQFNIGNAVVKEIPIDVTNAISYENMTDKLDYFKNENLKIEKNSGVDKKLSQEGVQEKTGTLKDIGLFNTVSEPEEKLTNNGQN